MSKANFVWYGDKVLRSVEAAKKAALTRGCQIVEGHAKLLIRNVSGGLAGSLSYKVDGDEAKVGSNVVAKTGSKVFYAPYVEFGTGKYAEKGDGRKTPWVYKDDKGKWWWTAGSRPRPFLRPALDNNRDQIMKAMGEIIGKAAEAGGKK